MKDYEIDYKKLYEEEHKKYEGALERARGHHSVASHYSIAKEIEELEHIFPELKEKESEDEKVRKSIIKLLQVGGYMSPEDKDKAFAWLKKQGELSKYNPYKETVESISTMVDRYSRADSDLQDFYDNVKVKCKDAIEYYNTFIEKQDGVKKKHNEIYETIKEKSYKEGVEDGILTGTKIQESTDNIVEEEKSLLEKFKQAVYDCAWEKVTCKKEGETKEEYANRWAEHFLLMVRDWADDYIDFTIQQKLRNSFEKGKTKTEIIEKQSKQKPADKVKPKFKVGDIIKYVGEREEFSKEKHTIKKILDDCYLTIDDVYIPFKFEEYYILINQNQSWSEEDEFRIKLLESLCEDKLSESTSNSTMYDEMKITINWLKSLKERVQPEQKLNEEVVNECVDLGLPSGTLWKHFNEEGYYTYDEAVEKFGDNLPTREQWEELKGMCKWKWKGNGYDVTGPNGHTIYLHAEGCRNGTEMFGVGTFGVYWSNTYYGEEYASGNNGYRFDNNDISVYNYDRYYSLSVRLVRRKKGE